MGKPYDLSADVYLFGVVLNELDGRASVLKCGRFDWPPVSDRS